MTEYTPILALGALAAGFAVFSILAGSLTGPKRYNRARLDRYESGIEPSPLPEGGGKVSIKYFFTAMMFIVFDIEIVFLYPFAVAFDQLSWFAFFAVMLFLLNITIAYVYEWRRGGMEWT
jgi:NADH-quinone oxidoreductase subunit A